MAPIGSVGEESYLLLWEKSKTSRSIYFVCVQDIGRLLDTFSPENWSFLHFWKDGDTATSKPTLAPPPGLGPRPSNDVDGPMSPGPDDGPSLILDEEMPAGHHLVQPASASPGMPGQGGTPDVPMAEPPRLSELGGGSLQPLGGESLLSRGNTQPHRNETAPSRRQTITTTVKPPPKPRPDKNLKVFTRSL